VADKMKFQSFAFLCLEILACERCKDSVDECAFSLENGV
jgi:hypothetical protein